MEPKLNKSIQSVILNNVLVILNHPMKTKNVLDNLEMHVLHNHSHELLYISLNPFVTKFKIVGFSWYWIKTFNEINNRNICIHKHCNIRNKLWCKAKSS